MKPSSLLRAVIRLLVTVLCWAKENDFATFDGRRRAAGVPEADRAGGMRCVKRLIKKKARVLRKQNTDPASKRFLQRLCKRLKYINLRLFVVSCSASAAKQFATFLDANTNNAFVLEEYRITPAERNLIAEAPTTDCFHEFEIRNLLPGVPTGMQLAGPVPHAQLTRQQFGIVGQLNPIQPHVIFHHSGFNVPNMRNLTGHNCSVNVGVRFFASMGAPFIEMAHASLAGVSRTQNLNAHKRDTLAALLSLLENNAPQYPPKDADALRLQLFGPDMDVNDDLDFMDVLQQLLDCLNRASIDRFTSYVDRVRECPRPGCEPHQNAGYPTLTRNSTLSEVPVYCWARPNHQYNDLHDDYQRARLLDFHAPGPCRFACSFRHVGNSREDRINYCAGPCDIKGNIAGGVACQTRERLTEAHAVTKLPRWQIIQLKINVANPNLPNDHPVNRPSFDALSATPHATLDLHGYYEHNRANRDAEPNWNDDHSQAYRLRGYVLLSLNYRHIAWRMSVTSASGPRYLHCDDDHCYIISQQEYEKPGQKIMCLLYETSSAAAASTASTSKQLQGPPKFDPRPENSGATVLFNYASAEHYLFYALLCTAPTLSAPRYSVS